MGGTAGLRGCVRPEASAAGGETAPGCVRSNSRVVLLFAVTWARRTSAGGRIGQHSASPCVSFDAATGDPAA